MKRRLKLWVGALRGLDEQQLLGRGFDLSLPAIHRGHGRDQVDAGRKTGIDTVTGDGFSLGRRHVGQYQQGVCGGSDISHRLIVHGDGALWPVLSRIAALQVATYTSRPCKCRDSSVGRATDS